ncbi:FAD-binding protein [Seongchinamella sediminis]|uniref:FAD-binding protein n=1 Tax=Seongchinamella sediminis TaxID=2283635 RepID=A0A3L7E3D8_9GAMM|nr:D-arabinono-1,4-lactone oxidase [Seongchinamella sediminis]RLQ22812.1 FAD-binding protein [Seongchinamella sediminis]
MLNRRRLLAALATLAVAGTGGLRALAAEKRRLPWRNWSGSQHCLPEQRVAPASVADLQELLASSTGVVRPVGAGHSFSPLVPTDGTLVSLSRLGGVSAVDADSLQATIGGGTRLGDIGQPLQDAGQALLNMPDIDEQTLAGCIATATHGTGIDLGCMSSFVTGLQLVDARGQVVDCDADNNPELFQAARVSLGSLGLITQVRLQNTQPYRLRREAIWMELEEILANAELLAASHRNFEFYYVPFSGWGFTDTHDITDEPIGATDREDPNEGVMSLKSVRDWMESAPALRRFALGTYARFLDREVTVANSWSNYASERNVRFNEMEYHLPRESGLQALREVISTLESSHHEVFFPLEVRFVKADDIWLSPFQGRDSVSIAVHRYFEEDYQPYFTALEPIFRKYGGRPHWGKLNTLTAADFRELYPHWDDFAEIRRQMDPGGRFLNPYLSRLFAAAAG